MSPTRGPTGSTKSNNDAELAHAGVWIGAFGRWYAWRGDDQEQDEEAERHARLERGVIAMEVEEPFVDSPSGESRDSDTRTERQPRQL